jgi:hypothetical protein
MPEKKAGHGNPGFPPTIPGGRPDLIPVPGSILGYRSSIFLQVMFEIVNYLFNLKSSFIKIFMIFYLLTRIY